MTHEDKPLNSFEISEIWIQGQLDGAVDDDQPYTFYIDGIQLYPVEP